MLTYVSTEGNIAAELAYHGVEQAKKKMRYAGHEKISEHLVWPTHAC